jgi:hypothetical protein
MNLIISDVDELRKSRPTTLERKNRGRIETYNGLTTVDIVDLFTLVKDTGMDTSALALLSPNCVQCGTIDFLLQRVTK